MELWSVLRGYLVETIVFIEKSYKTINYKDITYQYPMSFAKSMPSFTRRLIIFSGFLRSLHHSEAKSWRKWWHVEVVWSQTECSLHKPRLLVAEKVSIFRRSLHRTLCGINGVDFSWKKSIVFSGNIVL